MANTTNMIRLMTHAADLLDNCDPMTNAKAVIIQSGRDEIRIGAMQRALAETAAIGTASAVLRMVAAAMDDEPAAPATSEREP